MVTDGRRNNKPTVTLDMLPKCTGTTKSGSKCNSVSLKGGKYCQFHDPERVKLAALAKQLKKSSRSRKLADREKRAQLEALLRESENRNPNGGGASDLYIDPVSSAQVSSSAQTFNSAQVPTSQSEILNFPPPQARHHLPISDAHDTKYKKLKEGKRIERKRESLELFDLSEECAIFQVILEDELKNADRDLPNVIALGKMIESLTKTYFNMRRDSEKIAMTKEYKLYFDGLMEQAYAVFMKYIDPNADREQFAADLRDVGMS